MKIEIYDQVYNLSAEPDEAYVRNLAAYVDTKMRAVADATRAVDSLKVAVLAAINIADEFFALQKRHEQFEGPLRQRVERCLQMIDEALEPDANFDEEKGMSAG